MTIKPFALRLLLVSTAALCWQTIASEAPGRAGESRFSDGNYVEYLVGDSPLIISAPHGGRLKPAEMADRRSGTLTSDMNTDRLAEAIAEAFQERTGKTPHVIICHVARIKVDCNRDLEEAAQGDPGATQVWNDFHAFIKQARDAVLAETGKGLYLDIHGHGHPAPMQELGYLLRNSQLKQDSASLNDLAPRSSIRTLAKRSDASFIELLRGATSFGALLQKMDSLRSPAQNTQMPATENSSAAAITRLVTALATAVQSTASKSSPPKRAFAIPKRIARPSPEP